MEEAPVTLVSLGQGAAVELFDIELERVLKNIVDVNTDPTATREITLKVRIKPNDERVLCGVLITCTSKVASGKGASTVMFAVRRQGQVMAIENNPTQQTLDNLSPMPLKGV